MQGGHLEEKKISIVGAGIAGAMEAYFAYRNAKEAGEKIRITIYEKHQQLSSTTVANLVPGLTAGEITGTSTKGLSPKLQSLFSQSGGVRVDDVPDINTTATENFKIAAETYHSSADSNAEKVLWEIGKRSMELWQSIYDNGDTELQEILKESNFNPCREPKSTERTVHDGYKIYLIYNTPGARELVNGRMEFYKSLGYNHCAVLSPKEVQELDPSLAEFCKSNSKLDGSWNDNTVAAWRPGGCIDTQVFLPKFYDYLRKKMGKDSEGKDLFQLKLGKEVVEVGFNGDAVQSLKFADSKITSQRHKYLSSTYVFCPGEAVGTLKKLGFEEPACAGFAGASLMLKIPLTDAQKLEFAKFNTAIVIARAGVGLSCQARLKEGSIFIGVAGAQAFYGEQKPSTDHAFCQYTNLLQLNMINNVFSQFVSLALGWDTKGCELTQAHLGTLENENIAKRWVGTRAVTYDGFPTLGSLYKGNTCIQNARTTTGLGSGGASFSPACVQISQASLQQVVEDPFVSKVLNLTSSTRSASK